MSAGSALTKFRQNRYKDEFRQKMNDNWSGIREETTYIFCYDEEDCLPGLWNVFMFREFLTERDK